MVRITGMKIEGNGIDKLQVSHLNILQALIFKRRLYVNLMCKCPSVCELSPTSHSSPLVATLESEDRHVAKRVELCRFGESRCFAESRCF